MTADRILSIARSYIGVVETQTNNVIFNTAYYGREVNGSQYAWCAVFIWYVFREAGASDLYFDGDKTAYCPTLMSWFKTKNRIYTVPKAGDIVFYNFSGGKTATHVGIVSEVGNGTIKAIEGNTSSVNQTNGGMVMERTRSLSVCIGFARPKYEEKSTDMVNNSNEGTISATTNKPSYVIGQTYTLQTELRVRRGPGTSYQAKTHSQLTTSGKAHDKDKDGALDKGTRVTCMDVQAAGDDIWIRCPSGWLAAYYGGKVYIR